jgi:lactate dehydrogenase-like 2-hydroxyacid dehydrogenase
MALKSNQPEILSIGPMPPALERVLDDTYCVHRASPPLDGLDWPSLARVRGLITGGGTGAKPQWLDRLPALEIIAVNGVGLDRIDLPDAARRGLRVTNTPDLVTNDVADLAIGLLIALARRVCVNDRFVRSGGWTKDTSAPLARSLSALRVGVLGLGRIGLAIARRCEPMVASISYYNRTRRGDVAYAYFPSLEALARASDVLFVAADGAAGCLVGPTILEALGPNGLLINISRGALVDEAALSAALAEGRLGGAGLDVFAREPDVPQALIGLDRVVLQPHMGTATVEVRTAMGQLVMDNLAAHFAGRPLPTAVI